MLTSWGRQRGGLVGTRKERPGEKHSRPGDGKVSDLSGQGKKATERGALTLWRCRGGDLSGHGKESDRERDHSLPGDGRGRHLSGHGKKATKRGTHVLETAEGAICQHMERKRPREGHSPSGNGRGMNLSGYSTKATEQGPLTSCRRQRKRLVRTRKEIE